MEAARERVLQKCRAGGQCPGPAWGPLPCPRPPTEGGGTLVVRVLVAAAASAVTAAISAAEAAAPSAPMAAAASVLTRPGLVDGEGAAIHIFAVESGDGGLCLLVVSHLDESETLGATGVAVHDDLSRLHSPVRREQLFQSTVAYAVGQIAHVQLFAHWGLLREKSMSPNRDTFTMTGTREGRMEVNDNQKEQSQDPSHPRL